MKRREFVWAAGATTTAVLTGCDDGGAAGGTGGAGSGGAGTGGASTTGGAASGGSASGGTTTGGSTASGGTTSTGGSTTGGSTSAGGTASGGDTNTGGTGGSMGASCGSTLLITEIDLHDHDFEMQVPEADIVAGTEQTYMLDENDGHTHQITVTAADFTQLKMGMSVTVVSTEDGDFLHTHDVTLVCGDPS